MTLHFSPDKTDIGIRSDPERTFSASTGASFLAASRAHLSGKAQGINLYRRAIKRFLDILLTLIAAPVVLPLVVLMAALIALDGYNPFYTQMRVGRQGRIFRMWKLRTMVHDAETQLETFLSENTSARIEWDTTQKLKSDPRVTWVGRILRKTSFDELPQLWNVLTGDMSLVGPRPMMVCQKPDYLGTSYYRMSPGITGLWQISDRNECDFIKRVEYDDIYDQIISLKTDLQILVRTVRVVLSGTGY